LYFARTKKYFLPITGILSFSSIICIVFHHYSQYSDIEGISADYWREEKKTKHSRTPVNQWVLLGSVLSASEKVA
jgi:hypothetical protein